MPRQPDKGIMSAELRAKYGEQSRRNWANPALREKMMRAMRRVDQPAVLAAVTAVPRRAYKLIASDLGVSERYVQQIALGAGIRRNRARKAPAADDHHQAEACGD